MSSLAAQLVQHQGHSRSDVIQPPSCSSPQQGSCKVCIAGSWTTVFLKASHSRAAVKRQYELQRLTRNAFSVATQGLPRHRLRYILPHIPTCYEYFDDISTAKVNTTFLDDSMAHSSAYSMEYIRAISVPYTKYLLQKHLEPASFQSTWPIMRSKGMRLKAYLGATKPSDYKFTDAIHDPPAYLDDMFAEKADVDRLAASTGAGLAILHWICGLDARGVKLILGNDRSSRLNIWLVNFERCQLFIPTADGLESQLVDAICDNEPFWPRHADGNGLGNVWLSFAQAYLDVSKRLVMEIHQHLPGIFIDSLSKHHSHDRRLP